MKRQNENNKIVKPENVGAVYTHTHTHTGNLSKKILISVGVLVGIMVLLGIFALIFSLNNKNHPQNHCPQTKFTLNLPKIYYDDDVNRILSFLSVPLDDVFLHHVFGGILVYLYVFWICYSNLVNRRFG